MNEEKVEEMIRNVITKKNFVIAFVLIVGFIVANAALYIVQEGHIGIVKRFGEAIEQVDPGVHVKMPFVDVIVPIEVRTRKNQERMLSSTFEQMPITAHVSVNWTVNKSAAIDLYRKYGGLEQFENRILDPKFGSVTKSVLPHYKAEKLIQDRSAAITKIQEQLKIAMQDFDLIIDSVQIENIVLPPKYIASIEAKQTAKNNADAENHKLAQQALKAQQQVNTANAQRDSDKAIADGQAYSVEVAANAEAKAIEVKGAAEAKAITAKAKALKNNPLIIELTEAQRWNGSYLTTGLGDGAKPLVMIK